jgi:hypothetical protein
MSGDDVFDPENRSLYTSILRAPEGYVFDCALATTYTLDFGTALVVPAILTFDNAENAADIRKNPLFLLQGLEKTAQRIAIFCDRGHIKGTRPHEAQLLSLLERTIHEVRAPRRGAFHPKIWCLRFAPLKKSAPAKMRLAILSRNITMDRSWDLNLCLEGDIKKRRNSALDGANPIVARFIEQLSDMVHADDDKVPDFVETLRRDILKCHFLLPDGATDLQIAFNGVNDTRWQPPNDWDSLTVVSPFVTKRGLDHLRNGHAVDKVSLVSRAEELDALKSEVLANMSSVQVLSDSAEDEVDIADANDISGLHAKAFIYTKKRETTLVLGSANATAPALVDKGGKRENVEILVTLTGTGGFALPDSFNALLATYDVRTDEPSTKPQKDPLREAHHAICGLQFCQTFSDAVDGSVQITLTLLDTDDTIDSKALDKALDTVGVRVAALGSQNQYGFDLAPLLRGETQELSLGETRIHALSKWVVVNLTSLVSSDREKTNFCLGTTLENCPEGRLDAVWQSIFSSPGAFLDYLKLMLGLVFDPNDSDGEPDAAGGAWRLMLPNSDGSILEPLLHALAKDPDTLNDIDALLAKLTNPKSGESVVPEDFETFWASFRPFLTKKRRST